MGAAHGRPALSPAAACLLAAAHLARTRDRVREAAFLGGALIVGVVADTILVRAGAVRFATGPAALPPAWMAALWPLFAALLRGPLRWLRGRIPLAAILGAAGGPLSYAAGARLGAIVLGAPAGAVGTAGALAAVGAAWALAMPALLALDAATRPPGDTAGVRTPSPGPG